MKKTKALEKAAKLAKPQPIEIHLRAQIHQAQSALTAAQEQLGSREEFLGDLKTAVAALEPYPRPRILSFGAKGHSDITAVVKLSDWHVGEKIRLEETEGFGTFNWEIAQKRVNGLVDKIIEWVITQRSGYRIPSLAVLVEGDLVSGDIHEELRVTNEFPLPVQTANAGHLLAHAIARFAPYFDQVNLYETGGDNHGRLVKKPQAKQKAANNMMFTVYAIANAFLRAHKNISIVQPEGIKQLIDIGGWKFLSEHGDNTKAWMGIPFYGINRARGREAIRRMRTSLGFDYMSCGHWHVPNILEDAVFINGSLSGTSEYDHIAGRHARPSQTSFLVHPKYGYFNYVAWKLR